MTIDKSLCRFSDGRCQEECDGNLLQADVGEVVKRCRGWIRCCIVSGLLIGFLFDDIIVGALVILFLNLVAIREANSQIRRMIVLCHRGIWLYSNGAEKFIPRGIIKAINHKSSGGASDLASKVAIEIITSEQEGFALSLLLSREDQRQFLRILTLMYPQVHERGPWFPGGTA